MPITYKKIEFSYEKCNGQINLIPAVTLTFRKRFKTPLISFNWFNQWFFIDVMI